MLKKFINKNTGNQKPIFPQVNHTKIEMAEDSKSNNKLTITNTTQIVEALLANQQFINNLAKTVATIVLEDLTLRYEFEPTDKYKEEVANKKKYLNQLDSYLQERKEINQIVEGELGVFLQQTTDHLTRALESFSTSIQSRIRVAETRHGIDIIKQSILVGVPHNIEGGVNEE